MAEAECVPNINHFVLIRGSGNHPVVERDWNLRRCKSLETRHLSSSLAFLPAVQNYLHLRAKVTAYLIEASRDFDLHLNSELSADLRDLHPDDVLDAYVDKLGAQMEAGSLSKRRQLDILVGVLNFKDFNDSKRMLNRIVSKLRSSIVRRNDRSCQPFEKAQFLPSEITDLVFINWIADIGKKLPGTSNFGISLDGPESTSSTAGVFCSQSFSNIVAAASQELIEAQETLKATTKSLFKNYLVLKKCEDMKRKILGPARCKICAETFDIDHLADHSFQCFETKILREELDKINRMIIKLKNNSRKAKASIRRLS
jgi:hypothetical protein